LPLLRQERSAESAAGGQTTTHEVVPNSGRAPACSDHSTPAYRAL